MKFVNRTKKALMTGIGIIMLCLCIVLFVKYELCKEHSLTFRIENVKSIDIGVGVLAESGQTIVASATLSSEKQFEELKTDLKDQDVFSGNYSVYDLEGDSPTATIDIYYKDKSKEESIYFYNDIVRCNEKYYKITPSVYEWMACLCKKYGHYKKI